MPGRCAYSVRAMETLDLLIRYSKPGVNMAAEGHIGSRPFALESKGYFIRSNLRVTGSLGAEEFLIKGRTKNLINRDFRVAGHWASSPLKLALRGSGRRLSVTGHLGDTPLDFALRFSAGAGLDIALSEDWITDLTFGSGGLADLVGKVPQYQPAGIVAAFLPCLLRNLHGSINANTEGIWDWIGMLGRR